MKMIMSVVLSMVAFAAVAQDVDARSRFADAVSLAFKQVNANELISLTRESDKTSMSNSLVECRGWFSKFKGREIVSEVTSCKLYYGCSDEILKSIEAALPHGELHVLYLIAMPPVDDVSCVPLTCCLHFVEEKRNSFRLVGYVGYGPFLTARDATRVLSPLGEPGDRIYSSQIYISDNPYAWKAARWIRDILNTGTVEQIRSKLSVPGEKYEASMSEPLQVVSAARAKKRLFHVLPHPYASALGAEDADTMFNVWTARSGSSVIENVEEGGLLLAGKLLKDGSCSIMSISIVYPMAQR